MYQSVTRKHQKSCTNIKKVTALCSGLQNYASSLPYSLIYPKQNHRQRSKDNQLIKYFVNQISNVPKLFFKNEKLFIKDDNYSKSIGCCKKKKLHHQYKTVLMIGFSVWVICILIFLILIAFSYAERETLRQLLNFMTISNK